MIVSWQHNVCACSLAAYCHKDGWRINLKKEKKCLIAGAGNSLA
jgi:hypothetical protein